MRIAGVREFRKNTAALVGGMRPILVTKHGKIAGLYLPLEDPTALPADLRLELSAVLGRFLSAQLNQRGVSEKTIEQDFNAYRRRRRRR